MTTHQQEERPSWRGHGWRASRPRRPFRRRRIAAVAVAIVVLAAGNWLRLTFEQGAPPVVTTPQDNGAIDEPPAFQAILSAGDGTVLAGNGRAYWCTASSCAGEPSVAARMGDGFGSVTGGVLPDGKAVLAGITEVRGKMLQLVLLSCTQRACNAAGGGTFTAPGFDPAAGLNVYAGSMNGAGFAVAFGNIVNAVESPYVVVCDSVRCEHPTATHLGGMFMGFTVEPGVGNVAVAAAPHGGFSVAMPNTPDTQINVYECVEAPCRAVRHRRITAPAACPWR